MMFRKLLARLRRLLKRKPPPPPSPQSGGPGQTVSEEEVRKRLEGLGYIE